MRCAVIAAVLLLVYIQDAAGSKVQPVKNPTDNTTIAPKRYFHSLCQNKYAPKQCRGGWYRIDPERCAKYFMVKKKFHDAKRHCRSLGSNLVSMHNHEEYLNVLCLARRTTNNGNLFWIGGRFRGRQGFAFKWIDGTPYNFQKWYAHQPDHVWERCVEMNSGGKGRWSNAQCKLTQYFMCAKNM